MPQNDFGRSNLQIQTGSRLMSARANVETEEIDPSLRGTLEMMENFRGLSRTVDDNIDNFIVNAKKKGQEKADMYLNDAYLNPNHKDHAEAKRLIDSQKPLAKNFLGADYWTQQYIYKAQADELFRKEQQKLELEFNDNVNLSPDEYYAKLQESQKAFAEETSTYPEGVKYYLNKMPVRELQNQMREKHIREVSKQQLQIRDNIFTNKIHNQALTIMDTYDIPEDETLLGAAFGALEPEEKKLLQGKEYEPIPNDKVLDEYELHIINRNRYIAKQTESLLAIAREGAGAGMQPERILELTVRSLTAMVEKEPELEDEAAMILQAFIKQGNTDSSLMSEVNSWTGYTDNNKITGDKDKALFTPINENYFKEVAKEAKFRKEQRDNNLHKSITNVTHAYLKERFPNDTDLRYKAFVLLEWLIKDGIANGEFTDEHEVYNYGAMLIQQLAKHPDYKEIDELYTTLDNEGKLQPAWRTRAQSAEALFDNRNMESQNYDGLDKPAGYMPKGQTYDEFKNSDTAKSYAKLGLNEEQIKGIYNIQYNDSRKYEQVTRQREIADVLEQGDYSTDDLTLIVKENPELVKDILNIEFKIEDGKAVPANSYERKLFNQASRDTNDMKKILKKMKLLHTINYRYGKAEAD